MRTWNCAEYATCSALSSSFYRLKCLALSRCLYIVMDPTCCNNLPKSTYDNELLLYLANVLRIFLLYLCHLHPDGEIACRSPQTLRITTTLPVTDRVNATVLWSFLTIFIATRLSKHQVTTKISILLINTTSRRPSWPYFISAVRYNTTTHVFDLLHHHIILPRQKKKSRGESKQRKEKYWRGRPPILSKKGKFCRQIWGKILDNFG